MPARLTQTRIASGTWQGLLVAEDGGAPPDLDLWLEGEVLARARLTPAGAGHWTVRATIPADVLRDGVQTFALVDAASGTRLAAFSIAAGVPLGDDILGEIALLRDEVDLLKRALQRLLRGEAAAASPAAEAAGEGAA